MNTAARSWKTHEQAPDSVWVWRTSGLAAEPVLRNQNLRREGIFPVPLTTSRIDWPTYPTRLIPNLLKVVTTHIHIALGARETLDVIKATFNSNQLLKQKSRISRHAAQHQTDAERSDEHGLQPKVRNAIAVCRRTSD